MNAENRHGPYGAASTERLPTEMAMTEMAMTEQARALERTGRG